MFQSLIHVQLFTTQWTVCQAPLSMEFSRQEYWSGLPFPSPGDLPNPGIKPGSPALPVDSLPSEPPGKPQEYWSGLPFCFSEDLPNPGTEPRSPLLQTDSLFFEPTGKPFICIPIPQKRATCIIIIFRLRIGILILM